MTTPASADPRELARVQVFEAELGRLVQSCRLLPALTAANAVAERVRLCQALEAGEMLVPRFLYSPRPHGLPSARELDVLRRAAGALPAAPLYEAKIEELTLDAAMLAGLGDPRRIRPLSARRFGTGDEVVPTPLGEQRLSDYARTLIVAGAESEARTLPALTRDGSPCLALLVYEVAARSELSVTVRVEPNLAAGAAAGDHTVYIADRSFGVREALRLAVHEVLGHLTSAANGRTQPLRLLEWGTAGSLADQEGVALCMEQAFGVLDAGRLSLLAGRVIATSSMHAGASFGEVARLLFCEHGFSASDTVAITERAFRGGGVARDAGYLRGYLRVRAAVDAGETTLDELRMGRVGVSALPALRELDFVREPRYRPNFSRSFFSTSSGTMPFKSPPSAAASLMSVELT